MEEVSEMEGSREKVEKLGLVIDDVATWVVQLLK